MVQMLMAGLLEVSKIDGDQAGHASRDPVR